MESTLQAGELGCEGKRSKRIRPKHLMHKHLCHLLFCCQTLPSTSSLMIAPSGSWSITGAICRPMPSAPAPGAAVLAGVASRRRAPGGGKPYPRARRDAWQSLLAWAHASPILSGQPPLLAFWLNKLGPESLSWCVWGSKCWGPIVDLTDRSRRNLPNLVSGPNRQRKPYVFLA
jgi:hypothetical protein